MKRNVKFSKGKSLITAVGVIAICVVGFLLFSSCGTINTYLQQLKGELIGNDYNITEYDHYGNPVLRVSGDKIRMDAETDNAGEPTSYINITIDGFEWKHVGATLVFAQNGADMITDFALPEHIESNGDTSTGLMSVDRFINNYKNAFGRGEVVLVSSQNGVPIGLFRGDKCIVTIPDNLPKTTLIDIDGKLVYIHRGIVDIIPTGLFDN